MFTRLLPLPKTSFFLFGPRGTGKSTWIRAMLPDALVINLLEGDEMLRFETTPAELRSTVLAPASNQ